MSKQIRPASLKKAPSRSLRIKAYRVIASQLAPLSLEGSLKFGGRYNPPYRFGAIYCARNEETCWAEIAKRLEGPVKRTRFKVVPIRVRLNRVLDLTDSQVLSRLKITLRDLTDPNDHTLTRRIAEAAREAGFEAILAPSSAGPGTMLAVFSDRLDSRSKLTLVKRRKPRQP
ncbi:MAG: RES family NAD+ phosphorylase [Nitrospiria bacterium]